MPSMTTALTEAFSSGNVKRYIIELIHTAQNPQLVVQTVKTASSQSRIVGTEIKVDLTTSDGVTNERLDSRVVLTATARYPANCNGSDVTAAIAYLRDIVASDEFSAAVTNQLPLKP